jgi:hypothetical protein
MCGPKKGAEREDSEPHQLTKYTTMTKQKMGHFQNEIFDFPTVFETRRKASQGKSRMKAGYVRWTVEEAITR